MLRVCLASCIALTSLLAFSEKVDNRGAINSSIAGGLAAGLAIVNDGLEAAVIRQQITGARFIKSTHGIVGEASTEEYLSRFLNRGGKTIWHSMTPRTGPQGLDHLFVKYNEAGVPVDLYVSESKWGSSRLGMTGDGRQMGGQWVNARLAGEKVGKRYLLIGGKSDISCRAIPKNYTPNAEMSIMIKDAKGNLVERLFWRESSDKGWLYSGSVNELKKAQQAATNLGKLYEAAATGKISYRKSVCHWNIDGNDLTLRFDTFDRNDMLIKGSVKNGNLFVFKDCAKQKIPTKAIDDVVKKLKVSSEYKDWSTKDLRGLVRTAASSYKNSVEHSRFAVMRVGVANVGAATVGAAGIDAALQLAIGGKLNYGQLLETGVRTAVSVGAGELAGYLAMKTAARNLRFVRGAKFVATAIAFSAFDYYKVYRGEISPEEANVNAAISGGSMAAGAGTAAAFMAAPALMGATASTGTAIATLNGAAATNATLAFYGGGTVASGGFGVWGGALVVGGAAIVVAVGVAMAAAYGYSCYVEHRKWEQAKEWGNWLRGNLAEVQSLRPSRIGI